MMGFQDGELVTEQKLIYFLHMCVLGHTYKSNQCSWECTDLDGEAVVQTISHQSIQAYRAVIVNLWAYQQSCCINTHPHPVGHTVQVLLRSNHRAENTHRRAQYDDCGAGTLLDGYDESAIIQFVEYCWTAWSGFRQMVSVEPHLHTAVDFLMGHNMLLWGESHCKVELADLFTLELDNEGPTPCFSMMLIMSNGKTNQTGWIEYATVAWHHNPMLCTMSQLAFYLLQRWDIAQESLPQFHCCEEWYHLHLIKRIDSQAVITYETQLDWVNHVFSGTGLNTLKKTHAGWANGVKTAELAGVGDGQIHHAGQWNTDALSQSYLTNIPRKFVWAMSGFNPDLMGGFYIPQASVSPPDELVQALWPWADDYLQWFELYNSQDCESSFKMPEIWGLNGMNQLCEKPDVWLDHDDLAAQGFLHLLQQLCTILLQDSVILQSKFPGHPVWSHEVFQQDDYHDFARAVHLVHTQTEELHEVQLQQALPEVANQLHINVQNSQCSHDL